MIVPVRCFSCGKPVGHLNEKYNEQISQGKDAKVVLDELGATRYCCRAVLMGHIDLIDTAAAFKKA